MCSAWAPLHASLLLLWAAVSGTPIKDSRATCLLPPVEGPCRALLSRYYYDRHTQSCEEFSYGGCDGNDNNFDTPEDCEKACWMIKKVPKICRMEADEGPCRGYFKRYFYNLHSLKCEEFVYGGCYGNDNKFDDEASCMQYCAPKRNAPSFCYSPKDEGSCSASVTRYYYSPENKACEEFAYTGCGGNSNNFASLKDCNSVCKKGSKKPKIKNSFSRMMMTTAEKRSQ
ncbi:tissue factor pathway inhibitor 2 [Ambystoma mexicanum]|uniref:tissue factor pathway inhibitor 2 n=1 Tax=Ambystoma mexicanum TaxID=8296 RepID=UPI0037E7D690